MLSKTHTKYIQSLQHKKFRDELHLFIAEGPKVVMDLLTEGKFNCKEVFAVKEWLDAHDELRSIYNDTLFSEVTDFELEKISALSTAHHVLGIFQKIRSDEPVDCTGKITLALDTIQDPGNLGTIIRIADWFGIKNMICSVGCADLYNPKVVQSSMGSLGRINVVYTDLPDWIQKNKEVKIYAAALDGKSIGSAGKLEEGIIIIGNEANGISEAVMKLVDERITIPKTGKAESLNAAVATGIILSHLK